MVHWAHPKSVGYLLYHSLRQVNEGNGPDLFFIVKVGLNDFWIWCLLGWYKRRLLRGWLLGEGWDSSFRVRGDRKVWSVLKSKFSILRDQQSSCLIATLANLWVISLLFFRIQLVDIWVVQLGVGSVFLLSVPRGLNWGIFIFLQWFLGWLWFWSNNYFFLFSFLIWLSQALADVNWLVYEFLAI